MLCVCLAIRLSCKVISPVVHYVLREVRYTNGRSIFDGGSAIEHYNKFLTPGLTPRAAPVTTPNTTAFRPRNRLMLCAAWGEVLRTDCQVLANLEKGCLVSAQFANILSFGIRILPLQQMPGRDEEVKSEI